MNLQKEIIEKLNVVNKIENETSEQFIKRLIEEKSQFLKDYLEYSKMDGYILGLSGGVDSFVASMLVKHAGLKLISISLPCGTQSDIQDVINCKNIINPEKFFTHDILYSVNGQMFIIKQALDFEFDELEDYKKQLILGNIMARERMVVQYSYGSIYNCLVIGTDHATEAITGFYTKFGDGAADVSPLAGLTKDIIYEMAKYFNAPENIIKKAPSAGLWDNQTDEDELGLKYSDICSYLKGNKMDDEFNNKIEHKYKITEHKRHLPVTPNDNWWK